MAPSERVVEQRVIDTLRKVFELNGFIGIETRAVETGASLLKRRDQYDLPAEPLQEVGHESDTPIEERLGLHFIDSTVPLSSMWSSTALAFLLKRWQIQKVWRRASAGRPLPRVRTKPTSTDATWRRRPARPL